MKTYQSAPTSISSRGTQPPARRAVIMLLCLSVLAGPPLGIGALAQAPKVELGQSVARDMKGGESHTYQVALSADQYLSAVIEQRGVDVSAALVGPDGTKQAEADSAKGVRGAETLTFIAKAAGDYRLDVRAALANAASGQYEVKIAVLRAPTPDERSLEQARRLFRDARDLRDKGKYAEALAPAERALAIREDVLGPEHTAVADSLHFVAVIHDDTHEYAKAEPPNLRALAIREKALGPDHPDVARSLFNLAWLAKVKQDFAKAESLYRRALGIQERALGPDHSEVATTLNDLAVLYNQKGDFDQSILINQRVLAIREKALGPDDPGVAKALNNLARGHELKGDNARAGSLLQRAVSIWERSLGPNHPEVAFAVDGLARVYYAAGDYAVAEPLYLRALAIREKALGPDHTEVATTLNNLAMLYRQKGDYARAEPLVLRDLAITEKRLGPNHAFLAPSLSNLAAIYELQGDFDKAEPLYRRALAIQETALGPSHAAVGVTLSRLGQLYVRSKAGDPAQAQSLLQRALAVLETAVGPDHPGVPSSLGGLAALAESKGDRAQAERYYLRALAIQERTLGPDHPNVALSLDRLAMLRRLQGDAQQSVALLFRAHEIRERHLDHNLPLGSERQKLGYLKLFADDTDHALSLHARLAPHDPKALHLALTTLLRRKGRALDATSDNVALLRLRAAPQDQELLGRLSHARSQLAAVTLRGPGGAGATAYRSQLRQLEDASDQLEADLGLASAEFRAQSRPVTLDAVRAAIPEGAVLIEFALYRPRDDETENRLPSRYVAYVLTSHGEARWVDVGEAAEIDRAAESWRQALRDPRRADSSRLARALDAKVMQPVRTLLGTARHLLISPDGPLNLIPFAALVDEQSQYLVERYTITYLSSGRDLLRLQVPRDSRSQPVIVAAPSFGEPALVAADPDAAPRPRQNDRRPAGRAQVDYSQVFFGPLPGVGDEVRALKELLPQATFLVGEQATEAALRRVSGPRILHVATHGFFLRDGEDAPDGDPRAAKNAAGTRLGKWAAWAENPLLRSGLALAGANQGRSGDDDGVLTALEAAGLDLWGTKLVVLSACDTGVGEVRNGDGVYGLRRALVLAGAESQLMSLWPVSDRSTRDLMIGYYKLLTQAEGQGEALRQTQLRMLGDKRHAHPYYWASFIQSGEWAGLHADRRTKN